MTDDENGVILENAREYLDNPVKCIFCSSERIEIQSGPDIVMNAIFVNIKCNDCRGTYVEEYVLDSVHWNEEESVRKDEF